MQDNLCNLFPMGVRKIRFKGISDRRQFCVRKLQAIAGAAPGFGSIGVRFSARWPAP